MLLLLETMQLLLLETIQLLLLLLETNTTITNAINVELQLNPPPMPGRSYSLAVVM